MGKVLFLIFSLFFILEVKGQSAQEWFDRGSNKFKLNMYIEAIADFNKAIALDPKFFKAYGNRGASKYELQDYRGALADYSKVLELNSEDKRAYSNRGLTKMKFEDYEGAILDCNKAIELDRNYGTAYCNRGVAKVLSGQVDDGCLDLSKAGELGCERAYDEIKKYCQGKPAKNKIDDNTIIVRPFMPTSVQPPFK